MSEWKHGTHGTYVNGCRCDECRFASAAYKRDLYHRNIAVSRKYCREKMRRYAKRSHGDADASMVKRDDHLKQAYAAAEGELAELVAQQKKADTHRVWRPAHVRSLDETRWNGWGERANAEA